MIGSQQFDATGWYVVLTITVLVWFCAIIGYRWSIRHRASVGLIYRWRGAVLLAPVLIALAAIRLYLRR